MAFTNQERINNFSQILQGLVIGSAKQVWYEANLLYESALISDQILDSEDIEILKNFPASNLTIARNNASLFPHIIEDLSYPAKAVRLTPVSGTNKTVYVALSNYGDFSSERLKLWIQPQMIPQTSGIPSNGYAIRLFDGDPNLGGIEITTTQGTTGTGINKSVGWIPIYSAGILLLSEDFAPTISNPYWLGFRFIKKNLLNSSKKFFFEQTNFIELETIKDLKRIQVWTNIDKNFTFDSVNFDSLSFNSAIENNFLEKYNNYSAIYNSIDEKISIQLNEVKTGFILY